MGSWFSADAPQPGFVTDRGGKSTATVFATVTFYVIVLTMYLYLFPMLAIEQEEGRGLLGRRPRLYKSSVAMPDLITHLVYFGAVLNIVCCSWAFSTYFGNSDDSTVILVLSNYEEYKPIWVLGSLCFLGCMAPFFIRGMTKITPLPQLATEEDQPWNNRWLKIMDMSVDASSSIGSKTRREREEERAAAAAGGEPSDMDGSAPIRVAPSLNLSTINVPGATKVTGQGSVTDAGDVATGGTNQAGDSAGGEKEVCEEAAAAVAAADEVAGENAVEEPLPDAA